VTMLYKEQLNEMKCAGGPDCECGILYFHSRCHPSAGLEVHYEKKTGCLYLACVRCHRAITAMPVAELEVK
jgi:hypothetical protein